MATPNKVLGIDGGGTSLRLAVLDLDGELGEITTLDMPKGLPELITVLAPFAKMPIGMAMAGSWVNGRCAEAANNSWLNGIKLFEELSKTFGVPVIGRNDADAHARGLLTRCTNLEGTTLMVEWGTGINSRLLYRGNILTGGESGHLCIDRSTSARKCNCGRFGCVEAYAGGAAVSEIVRETLANLPGYPKLPEETDLNRLLDAGYKNMQAWATETYSKIVIPAMAELLTTIHHITPFQEVWWNGTFGLRALGFRDLEIKLRKETEQRIFGYLGTFHKMPPDIPVLGAALCARDAL